MEVRVAAFSELGVDTLYALLKLRMDVFVVEQGCAYPEIDGRDDEPGARHVWVCEDGGGPVAYLRILEEPDGSARIGRVATAKHARGRGLAGRLVQTALDVIGERVSRLDAQAGLRGFYERYGFAVTGPAFDEDGIAHIPMTRTPA
ncbi:GNAT family N-acetyltransferase [Bailinhaonella thermotolerans]|uniref:GNAT family N-acetyltransferase n=2 Tax=Bailinhaonella thermotolerans TaxID=1070861 RepID=A0A3A4B1G2_9ACTN|nr:GNAT family N-acetyltransferase [Bailinhaonella thermotolerans]RJL34659.1 GNAT family N-acetyltransferase [Bailinhaonella thermotolerans]